jgi:hypothetical protein
VENPEIQAVVDTFFGAFRSGEGLDARMDALRAVLAPEAVITKMDGHAREAMDVEAFVEPRRALLGSGRLEDFREWELDGRTEVFRGIAQHWCLYAKSWTEAGVAHHGRGAKSIQLAHEAGGWLITSVNWADDPE